MPEIAKVTFKELFADRLMLRSFLVTFLVFLALVVGVIYSFYKIEYINLSESIVNQQSKNIIKHQNVISESFVRGYQNIDLASRSAKRYFDGQIDIQILEDNFFDITSAHIDFIDQLRIIEPDGKEIVRINSTSNGPFVVQDDFLQDKSDRYYITEAKSLAPGDTYFSKIDLNVENGSVEFPYKPVFRIVRPIYDYENTLLGFVVLNVNARSFLTDISLDDLYSPADIWILNKDSFWLYTKNHDLEWGFLFNQTDSRLSVKNESLWAQVSDQENSVVNTVQGDNSLHVFVKFSPFPQEINFNQQAKLEVLYLVYVNDEKNLTRLAFNLSRRYTSIAFFAGIFCLVLSLVISLFYHFRKKTLEVLIKQQQLSIFDAQIRNALDIAVTPMVLVDQHQIIVYANNQAMSLFEINSADIGVLSINALVTIGFKDQHAKLVDRFFANPATRVMAPSREISGVTTSGKKLFLEITLSPVTSEHGNLVVVSVNDLSETLLLESDLAKSNRTMSLAIDTAQLGVWSWNIGESTMLWDARMLSIFGLPKNLTRKVAVQMWRDAIHQSDLAKVDRFFEQSLSSLEPLQFDYRVYTTDGQLKWLKCGIVCESLSKFTRLVGVVQEITEEKVSNQSIATINKELERRVEQRSKDLKQAYNELESFSYAVSHDLRSPLRSIDGFSNLLTKSLGDQLGEKDRDFLNRIRLAAQRMGELIDDMLSLSRITRADLVAKRIDLVEIAANIIKTLKESDPHRQINFICPEHLYANGDIALLRIALTNLLNNSWKFTGKKDQAVIELGIQQLNEESVFFVKDNGAGFDMKHIDKLFVPFQRLHSKQSFEGNGIGLATVQRIVEKHGGRVWAEGEVDKGASFYFTLL